MPNTIIDDITFSKTQYANVLKLCYRGFSISTDLGKFNRVKGRFASYEELDFLKRMSLLNELIILKNVFDFSCLVRVMLSVLDEPHWYPFITLASLLKPLPPQLNINDKVIQTNDYIKSEYLREFTND